MRILALIEIKGSPATAPMPVELSRQSIMIEDFDHDIRIGIAIVRRLAGCARSRRALTVRGVQLPRTPDGFTMKFFLVKGAA
jgi:hypothetical protein